MPALAAAPSSSALLSPEQAAEMLGLKPQTLSVWRCSGRYDLPFVRVGRLVKYRLADIEDFIERQTFLSTGEADDAAA